MRLFSAVFMAFVCVLFMTSTVLSGSMPTPTEPPEGVAIIAVSDAKQLLSNSGMQFFDMRKALNYGKGHLPGAVSLPYKWTSKGAPDQRSGEFNMSKLPKDKNEQVLFHSDGPYGWKSYFASKAAVEAGYKNVMWMREGFAIWKEKGYPVKR
jgi:rhodanese-related sulfurtransferase